MGNSSICSKKENNYVKGNSSVFSDSDNENENSKKKGFSIFSNLQKKKARLDYIECSIVLLHANELSDPTGSYKRKFT